jgi:hypothetical protein
VALTNPLDDIRRAILAALFSDDLLYTHLALKGGNALRLVYQLQERTSLDLDLSLDTEIDDLEGTHVRLKRLLGDRLDSAGYVAFDEKLEPRPPHATGHWGGYSWTFKVISLQDHARLGGEIEPLRRNALKLSALQERTWQVEISKYEYCVGKRAYELDSQTIYVYTPAMIAIEKLRALCQQLPAYPQRRHKTPRARDFYDIHTVVTRCSLDLEAAEHIETGRAIFAAKEVPLAFLLDLRQSREYHAGDWQSVQQSASSQILSFDVYFDFVIALAERLEALWEE